MNPPPMDTIIFDLGGVLIDWNPRHLFRKLFEEEQEMEHFLEHVCTGDWNEQQDGGRPFAEAIALKTAEFPEYGPQIKAFFERWPEMLGGPIEGTVSILEQIHREKRYRLLALTNWSHETWPVAWERYGFLKYFEDILVSGKEKLKKPDPRIYHLLLERNGVRPGQALFIDDSHRNVQAARQEGIRTIHFTNPTALRTALQQFGVIH
ncbi:HAD family hydrolase [Phaeodactylibacter xiamenensis]|uniref:HAD family hydrolase n=1 Tax=Phaeodactylibacter xiamenensis TaxID=1524460 RepID=UPI003BA8DCAA